MVIISIAAGLPDEEATTKRLLRNGPDMAATLTPLYGTEKANKFDELIVEHLVLAVQLVKAAKAGNSAKAAEIEKKWYKNADDIAVLVASINPYWSEDEWKKMLHEHLRLVKAQAVLRLEKDYAADVALYDEYEEQALVMADMMMRGVVQQFPASFA
ncbi:acetylglutamate kinase [Paenibacillus sacheonensis]|uniref:Acetylglutamate kinase n=1 Tax=Paenibacillus sacheonensis TaxID=742054 RepID=A0A7X4YW64_9BACL|nr:acetylglutamate kinase [Paenibacillus sacheonensis]MBM7569510.1 hypothetical protein [Paenibacillus sacheonensis]NBC73573.1 acetylglutamate kinase [Paenibacillus sacheonensis]